MPGTGTLEPFARPTRLIPAQPSIPGGWTLVSVLDHCQHPMTLPMANLIVGHLPATFGQLNKAIRLVVLVIESQTTTDGIDTTLLPVLSKDRRGEGLQQALSVVRVDGQVAVRVMETAVIDVTKNERHKGIRDQLKEHNSMQLTGSAPAAGRWWWACSDSTGRTCRACNN